jgi:two-component sensor histidine kinase
VLLLDFHEYKGDTLGLQLIRSLVNQLDGTLKIDNTNGTRYEIDFTKMNYTERV